jgi:membrane protease subunit (stomatin/prohibitin family)
MATLTVPTNAYTLDDASIVGDWKLFQQLDVADSIATPDPSQSGATEL